MSRLTISHCRKCGRISHKVLQSCCGQVDYKILNSNSIFDWNSLRKMHLDVLKIQQEAYKTHEHERNKLFYCAEPKKGGYENIPVVTMDDIRRLQDLSEVEEKLSNFLNKNVLPKYQMISRKNKLSDDNWEKNL